MKRSRVFLGIIIFLLVINTLFFLAWYAFDLQGVVKGIVEREAGKALQGNLSIADFTISDRQVFAENIDFAAADSSLFFSVENARVRYNLLKFIFSGFEIRNLLHQVEINQPRVSYTYIPKPKPRVPPPKKKFRLPDLSRYFNQLELHGGEVRLKLDLPLNLAGEDYLTASEELTQIEIKATNAKFLEASLSAVSHKGGLLQAFARMDQDRLLSSFVELKNYNPADLAHPLLQDFSTELNLTLQASQPSADADFELDAKALVWDTRATLLSQYRLNLPFLSVESDGDRLSAQLSRTSLGSSSVSGRIALEGLQKQISFDPSQLDLSLDLGMIDPQLQGWVTATVAGSGTVKQPQLALTASSESISYQDQSVSAIALEASYADNELAFSLNNAVWQNQQISLQGTLDPQYRTALAHLTTSPILNNYEELRVTALCDLEVTLYDKLPHLKAEIDRLSVSRAELNLPELNGAVTLVPLMIEGRPENYYVNLDLASADGTQLHLVGDLLDRNLLISGNFQDIFLASVYGQDTIKSLAPKISGSIQGFLNGDRIVASSALNVSLNAGLDFQTGLQLTGSYSLSSQRGTLFADGIEGRLNSQPLDFELAAQIEGQLLTLNSLRLNDLLLLSGWLDLGQVREHGFSLGLRGLDAATVQRYYPQLELPDIRGVNLFAKYNLERDQEADVTLWVDEVNIPGINPLNAAFKLSGPPGRIALQGRVFNSFRELVSLEGSVAINDRIDLEATALLKELRVSDLMPAPPVFADLNGEVRFSVTDLLNAKPILELATELRSRRVEIPDAVVLSDIVVNLRQSPEVLYVDSLRVTANRMAQLSAQGALDYNLLSQTFFDGNHALQLRVEGSLFAWLKETLPLVTEASGRSSFYCTVETLEDQFLVSAGEIDIRNGFIMLKDQIEPIRNLHLLATLSNNRLQLENFSCYMGDGKLTVLNDFEEDSSNHFFVGFLDLGSFRLKIEEPGILVNAPMFTTPRTLTNIVLRGQNSEYATVKGPFDDMRISAEAVLSNASAVFPPNTDNLLSLIYSFRDAFSRGDYSKPDPVPLPFTLDLMVRLRDNISYTTYPANISIQPGGFLHIVYNGLDWIPVEANFVSERGTIDFFGTVFQTERLNIIILESQNLILVEGSFYRRAADGTVITLSIGTDPDTSKPLFDRLSFNLSSDNPEDLTVTDMLARLRYSKNPGELTDTQKQSLLQDEALNLISGNLNTTLLSPFIYPIENRLRRLLKLDNFSISVGFIQNLFTEYSNDPNQLAEFTDMNQFMSDVTQFSSAILLNNLSVSMSKYLGRKFFLDYEFTLQEATDLQKRTKIVISHDTSLRVFLPHQFRLGYTFKYEPQDDNLTHEIMLQRSFRFWGL